MPTLRNRRRGLWTATGLLAITVLVGCASSDPLGDSASNGGAGDPGGAESTIVVGSQAYYSNEIIAEIYAQALEGAGFEIERKFSIGQRDAYMPEVENGDISVFPEYTGNLLQYLDPQTEARSTEDVYEALQGALPEGLAVLDQSTASDQDSYTVTRSFAEEYQLVSIEDLADVAEPLTLGGPPELAERPYGPTGLQQVYGIEVAFSATGDTTVEDLVAGTVNVANVFTADPRIQTEELVVLEDPQALILASHVVPLVNAELNDEVAPVLNVVSERLTPESLVALNVASTVDQKSATDIAEEWLADNALL